MPFADSVTLRAKLTVRSDGRVEVDDLQGATARFTPNTDAGDEWTVETASVNRVSIAANLFEFGDVSSHSVDARAELRVASAKLAAVAKDEHATANPLIAAWLAEQDIQLQVEVDGGSSTSTLSVELRLS